MKKELNFWEKTKKFFSPIKWDKLVYFYGLIIYFVWWVDRIIHVLFLERIIHYLELKDIKMFKYILIMYLIYIVFYLIIQVLTRKKWRTEISDTAIKFIQNIYLKKFTNLNNNHIEKFWTWKLTAIINNGIDRWWRLLDMFINQSINVLISFIFTGYMLYKSNDIFLIGFIGVYLLFYIVSYYLNMWAIKYRRKRRDNANYHTKNLVKVIMNKQEILQSDKISHELEILDGYKNKEIFYNKKMSNFLQPLFEWPNIILSLLILVLIGYLWNSYLLEEITLSTIVWIVSALIIMKWSVEKWIMFFKDFTKEFVDIEKLWEFFDNSPKINWYKSWDIFKYKWWNISLKNIWYSYIKGKKILDDFSIDIKWWKITAFVWDSWSWKSTIAKLIWWYIQHDKWDLVIDDQNIKDISLKSYYKNIWYLTQEPSVFDGTVLENLTYSVESNVDNSFVKEIIDMSKCEFIYDLPNGIDTEIWERGVKLSWWQRQRLAIAKIMIKNPKIIILDEPTSALDSFSEDKITKAMNNLFKWRTVIVIAHRLQTVKNASNIFVINDWKIVENWTHEELINKWWKYFKMLELQSWF